MYWKYLKYIIKHKWFVLKECIKYGMFWRGLTHDLSKFLPSEFIPYARYFYGNYPEWDLIKRHPEFIGVRTKEQVDIEFDIAWLKHQKRNKHHWQYWLLPKDDGGIKLIKIPEKYRYEMLCDWVGAGRAINGKPKDPFNYLAETKEWYLKNIKNIKIDDDCKVFIMIQLGINTYNTGGE